MPAVTHPKGFWPSGGDGFPYLEAIRDKKLTTKQVAETVGCSYTAVNSAYNHYILGKKYPSELKKRDHHVKDIQVDFTDPALKKVLNAISEFAASLISQQLKDAQIRISALEKENTKLLQDNETIKGEMTLQALAMKKHEEQYKQSVLRKAGIIHSND